MSTRTRKTYSILVTVESTTVETRVRIANAQSQRRSIGIGELVVVKVDVVSFEVNTSIRCVRRFSETRDTGTSQAGVEVRGNSQDAGVCVVRVKRVANVGLSPSDAHAIVLAVQTTGGRLSEKSKRAGTGDVNLLVVGSFSYEDVL